METYRRTLQEKRKIESDLAAMRFISLFLFLCLELLEFNFSASKMKIAQSLEELYVSEASLKSQISVRASEGSRVSAERKYI